MSSTVSSSRGFIVFHSGSNPYTIHSFISYFPSLSCEGKSYIEEQAENCSILYWRRCRCRWFRRAIHVHLIHIEFSVPSLAFRMRRNPTFKSKLRTIRSCIGAGAGGPIVLYGCSADGLLSSNAQKTRAVPDACHSAVLTNRKRTQWIAVCASRVLADCEPCQTVAYHCRP